MNRMSFWTALVGALLFSNVVGAPAAADKLPALLAYEGPDGNIWTIYADGSGQQQVTTTASAQLHFYAPQWSTDGAMLTFFSRSGELGSATYQVFVDGNGQLAEVPNVSRCAFPFFWDGNSTLGLACNWQYDVSFTVTIRPAELGFTTKL